MKVSLTEEQLRFVESLVEDYSDVLLKYGRRFVNFRPDYYFMVEDAVQVTFEKATRCVDTVMNHENVIGWLKRSCCFALLHEIDVYKKRRRREMLYADVHDADEVRKQVNLSSVAAWETQITRDEIERIVREVLSEDEKTVFHLHFQDHQTLAETAKQTGFTVGVVRGTIKRIQRKFMEYFLSLCIFLVLNGYIK